MLLLPLFALFSLPLCIAALNKDQARTELVKLASANDGIITIDDRTFDLLTMPNRDWSATVIFTALDPRRKCSPCKYVVSLFDLWSAFDACGQSFPAFIRGSRQILEERARSRAGSPLLCFCQLRRCYGHVPKSMYVDDLYHAPTDFRSSEFNPHPLS